MNMKKTLIALALVGTVSTANASEIDFKGSNFGGFDITFDLIDYLPETANVTQTDDNLSGNIVGPDGFEEWGSTSVVGFTLNNVGQPYFNTAFDATPLPSDMVLYFDFNIKGTADQLSATSTGINFTSLPSAELYLWQDLDLNNGTGTAGREHRVSLATFTLNGGACLLNTAINGGTGDVSITGQSACDLSLEGTFAAGNFFTQAGDDLSALVDLPQIDYDATVQQLNGLNFNYAAVGGTQDFTVQHDANMTIKVPEPTSIAILGLGLLGLAGARRSKS